MLGVNGSTEELLLRAWMLLDRSCRTGVDGSMEKLLLRGHGRGRGVVRGGGGECERKHEKTTAAARTPSGVPTLFLC